MQRVLTIGLVLEAAGMIECEESFVCCYTLVLCVCMLKKSV